MSFCIHAMQLMVDTFPSEDLSVLFFASEKLIFLLP